MKHFTSVAALALIAICLSACAGGRGAADGAAARGGSVEVFGTIDAAVTHTTTRTGR